MIEMVTLEWDEDGLHLILHGDLVSVPHEPVGCESRIGWYYADRLNLQLGQDAALQLREQVREKIDPWWAEGEAVRADHDHHLRTGVRPDYVRDLDDAVERDEPERLRDAADLERKRRREQA